MGNRDISRYLTDERLHELHEIVSTKVRPVLTNNSRRVKEGKQPKKAMIYIDGHEVQKALHELIQRRRKRDHRSPHAKALEAMEVGQTIVLPPLTVNQLKSYRTTARRTLGNDAMWKCRRRMDDGKIVVTRLPNGAKPQFADASEALEKLSNMLIGQTCLFDKLPYSNMRADARVRMKQPQAKWVSTKLSSGRWRVKRIR